MKIITLCGIAQAKVGFTFLAGKPSEQCVDCRLYKVCIGKLEHLRLYRVVEVRGKTFQCRIHKDGVKLVVVEESPVEAAVEDKLIVEGVVLTFSPIACKIECSSRSLCIPEGLRQNDRCQVVKVGEKLNCLAGLKLRKVILRRVL
ncbi:UPF0179 family protein [Candidatus Bathyarchaeota archaeon]|nr:UPF0179 family protein [Candidatus Bathyarchaeota archaeon]MBS7617708.1 UPF0179 family protein [Candidatus Bathyarchaeota archaeon]